jgi:hypothetical protein
MFEKPGSFGYRLFEAMQVKRLQISEAAMDDLQAVEAGVFTKVAFFQKQGFKAPSARFNRQCYTVNATTNDDNIIFFGHCCAGIA